MLKRKYDVDDHYFDVIDTEGKAYLLGLYYSDGTNYVNTTYHIKIDCAEDSNDIMNIIKDELKFTGDIKRYNATVKTIDNYEFIAQPSYRILFKSEIMSKRLEQIGMGVNKKYRQMPSNNIIPHHLLNHFIRGIWDGDGCIGYWIDNKNTNHKKFVATLCCTSDIVYWVKDYIKSNFHCSPSVADRKPNRENNNLTLTIDGNNVIRKFCDWLYRDAHLYMQRKYDKYQELIIENDRVANDNKLYGNTKPKRKVINILTKEIFESVTQAAKSTRCVPSSITNKCKKKTDGWMYYDKFLKQ